MPDLGAVFDARGIADQEKLLRTMEVALAPEQTFRTVKHTTHSFAAINVLKPFSFAPGQPLFQDDACLMIDGALFDDRPTDEVVRILFSLNPSELRTLNGQFNAVIFRPARNELTIVTDRLGCRPLYYSQSGQRHAISSEIKGVRAALTRSFDLSPVGLMELFAFGHNVDERTVLEGITVLPPGSVITIDESGVRKITYHEFSYSQARQSLSNREWGERISACLKGIIPKYLSGPARKGIFLSGGLDSRIVAGAIGDAGGAVHAYTFGDPQLREVRIAQDIARRMGFPHEVLTFPSNYLSTGIRDVVARTECATPFYHTTSIVFHDSIASETDSIFVGFGGSLSGSQLKRPVLRLSRRSEIAEHILNRKLRSSVGDIAQVFQPAFFDKYWSETIDAFHASFATIDEAHGADVADVWEMRNRQRRFTFSAPKVDRYRFEVVAPMLDKAYVDLMTSLPVDARWKQSAYRHAIVDGFPQLRPVPWAKTGRPVPSGRTNFWSDEGRRVGSKALHLALSRLGLGGNLSRDTYRDIAADLRHDEFLVADYLYPQLSGGSLSEEVFNPAGIRQLVESHMSGKDLSHLLGVILTVAVYFGR